MVEKMFLSNLFLLKCILVIVVVVVPADEDIAIRASCMFIAYPNWLFIIGNTRNFKLCHIATEIHFVSLDLGICRLWAWRASSTRRCEE